MGNCVAGTNTNTKSHKANNKPNNKPNKYNKNFHVLNIRRMIKNTNIVDVNYEDMIVKDIIASGRFSNIYNGIYNKQSVIIKMCNKARPKEFLKEIRMFSLLESHPYISKCHAIMSESFRIIMTKYKGDCFQEYIYHKNKFDYNNYKRFIHQMSNALSAMHDLSICHADIKPENILVDSDNNYYLTDFGLSSYPVEPNKGIRRLKGTPEYLPPEQVTQTEYGYLSDMWSFGMVCYELCCGYMCYYVRDVKRFKRMIEKKQIKIHFNDNCKLTEDQKDLISEMLQIDPESRITSSEIVLKIIN